MISTLAVVAMALIILRFVHPGIAYWLRDLVVAGQVNRRLMAAVDSDSPTAGEDFRALLEKTLRYQVGESSAQEIRVRCLRIREVLGIMAARDSESGSTRKVDLGGTIIELADMLQSLGARLRPGLDGGATNVVGAEQILLRIVQGSAEGTSVVDVEQLEEWLERQQLRIEQIGEIMIAAVYALASRQQAGELVSAAGRANGRQALSQASPEQST